jgi:hypothetical protein
LFIYNNVFFFGGVSKADYFRVQILLFVIYIIQMYYTHFTPCTFPAIFMFTIILRNTDVCLSKRRQGQDKQLSTHAKRLSSTSSSSETGVAIIFTLSLIICQAARCYQATRRLPIESIYRSAQAISSLIILDPFAVKSAFDSSLVRNKLLVQTIVIRLNWY